MPTHDGRSFVEAWDITTRSPHQSRQRSFSGKWHVADPLLHLGCMHASSGSLSTWELVSRWSIGWMPPSVFMLQHMNPGKRRNLNLGSSSTCSSWWWGRPGPTRPCWVCSWWQLSAASGGNTFSAPAWWKADRYALSSGVDKERQGKRAVDPLTTGACLCSNSKGWAWGPCCWISTSTRPRWMLPSSSRLWSWSLVISGRSLRQPPSWPTSRWPELVSWNFSVGAWLPWELSSGLHKRPPTIASDVSSPRLPTSWIWTPLTSRLLETGWKWHRAVFRILRPGKLGLAFRWVCITLLRRFFDQCKWSRGAWIVWWRFGSSNNLPWLWLRRDFYLVNLGCGRKWWWRILQLPQPREV